MIFEKWREEKIFFLIILIFGIIVLVLTPPMCSPDENMHFANAYRVGYGDILPIVSEGKVGCMFPQKIVHFILENNSKYVSVLNQKYSFISSYFDSWLPNSDVTVCFFDMGKLAMINPAGYIISGFGVFIGRVVGNIFGTEYITPYNLLLFARLFNLFFYIVVGYWAIKITPILKRTMLVLLLMPISIFLATSVSYDAILIPVCSLFFANTMKLILNSNYKVILKKDVFITLFCTFFMVGIKTAYAPFLILLFLIPREKFQNTRKYVVCIILTGIVAILVYIVPKIIFNVALEGYQLPTNDLIIQQKEYLLNNLYVIPTLFIQTFQSFWLFYLQSFMGKLGQLDMDLSLPMLSLLYVLLLIVLIVEINSTIFEVNRKIRILSVAMLFISIFGIFIHMYISWTPLVLELEGSVISGVQGRYFIPLFLFACIPFFNRSFIKHKRLNEKLKKWKKIFSEMFVCISGVLTCLVLILRYWI